MKSKIFGLLFKQYNLGKWLGSTFTQITNSFFYLSIINTVMLAITSWQTSLQERILSVFPWFNFWWFLIMIVFITLLVMFLDYKLVYPARQAFQSKQSYAHENPVRTDLERILEHNKKLDKDNEELKKGLDEIKKHLKIPDRKVEN